MPKKQAKSKASINIKIDDVGKLVSKAKGKAKPNTCGAGACGGGIYFLGVLGAAIYYISTATGFWMIVLGVLKSLVWPVFLVWGLLKHLAI